MGLKFIMKFQKELKIFGDDWPAKYVTPIRDFIHVVELDEAHIKVLDNLFENEGYGENWASWWLDFARYADTNGYEADHTRSIWRYRDWVINALNTDKPFNEFVIEQLAGDLMPNPSVDQFIATAFHRNTMTNREGGTEDEEYRVAAVIDRVNTTFEVLQSTTMSCVQCHSHPYDPIRHKEYYELMAFFNNTVDSDHNHNAPRLRIFDNKTTEKVEEVINWISEKGNNEIKKTFEHFIKFINPVYQANQFEIVDNEKAYFWSHVIGFRNGGEVLLKNANSLGYSNLYLSNNVLENDVTLIFKKDSKEGEIITEIDLNKYIDFPFSLVSTSFMHIINNSHVFQWGHLTSFMHTHKEYARHSYIHTCIIFP